MMWLWLTEVTPERGAMRILPGSHAVFMDHWEKTLLPQRRDELPRVHGLRPHDSPVSQQRGPGGVEALPPPPASAGFGAESWLDIEPTAAVAHRGQLLIHSGAMLHSAWHNYAEESRKGLLLQMIPCFGRRPWRIVIVVWADDSSHWDVRMRLCTSSHTLPLWSRLGVQRDGHGDRWWLTLDMGESPTRGCVERC